MRRPLTLAAALVPLLLQVSPAPAPWRCDGGTCSAGWVDVSAGHISFSEVVLGRGVVSRGGRALDSRGPLERDGRVLSSRGADCTEQLELVAPGTLEQRVVFGGPPRGQGPLELKLPLERAPAARDGTLEVPGLLIRDAVWVDARGERTVLALTWSRGAVRVSVPEAVLFASHYPAVLDPTLIASAPVDARVVGVAGMGTQDQVQLACGDTECIAAWNVNPPHGLRYIRVGGSGAPADPASTFVPATATASIDRPQVSFSAGMYLLAWCGYFVPCGVARVTPTGTLLDPQGLDLSQPNMDLEDPALAPAADGWLAVYADEEGDAGYALRARHVHFDGGMGSVSTLQPAPVSYASQWQVVPLGGAHLVAWYDNVSPGISVLRLDADGGVTVPSIALGAGSVLAASSGAEALLVRSNHVANTVEVLAIDSSFGARSAMPVLLATGAYATSVTWAGNGFVVAYVVNGGAARTVRVDPMGTVGAAVDLVTGGAYFGTVGALQGNLIAVWQDPGSGVGFQNELRVAALSTALVPSPSSLLSLVESRQVPATAQPIGPDLFAVWSDTDRRALPSQMPASLPFDSTVRVGAFVPGTLAPSVTPVEVNPGSDAGPRVGTAAVDGGLLVVWLTGEPPSAVASLVRRSGSTLGVTRLASLPAAMYSPSGVHAASNGEVHAAVFQEVFPDAGRRIDLGQWAGATPPQLFQLAAPALSSFALPEPSWVGGRWVALMGVEPADGGPIALGRWDVWVDGGQSVRLTPSPMSHNLFVTPSVVATPEWDLMAWSEADAGGYGLRVWADGGFEVLALGAGARGVWPYRDRWLVEAGRPLQNGTQVRMLRFDDDGGARLGATVSVAPAGPRPVSFAHTADHHLLMSYSPTRFLSGNSRAALIEVDLETRPVAVPLAFTTDEDTPLSLTLQGSDDELDALTFEVATPPAHGALSPSFVYTPARDYAGTDSFTYVANDGLMRSVEATALITVRPANDAPVAHDAHVDVVFGQSADVVLTGDDADGDPLTFALTGSPAHGTLTGAPPALVFEPEPGFQGDDAFTFTVSDGQLTSAPGTVTLSVVSTRRLNVACGCGATALSPGLLVLALALSRRRAGAAPRRSPCR